MIFFWTVFVYMVVEDFRYKTVDLSCVVLLILFSSASAENLQKYFIGLAVGLFIFRLIYLLSVKIYEKNSLVEGKILSRTGHGYLPSLGVSLILYFVLENFFVLPVFFTNYVEFFEMILQVPEVLITTTIFLVVVWIFFEMRLRRAEKSDKKIIYGFGGGDVLVLGIFAGVLGEKLFFVFFISLFVQLAEFISENVILGVQKN